MKILPKLFLLLFVSIFFIHCEKDMTFKAETYSNPNFCIEENNCLQIKLDVLKAGEDNPIKDSINHHVFETIKENLDVSEGQMKINNYVDLVNTFEKYYAEFIAMNKAQDSLKPVLNWEASALVKLNYQTEYFLNFAVEHYRFTGGAHGYGASQSVIIDAKTGRQLKFKNLFTDLKEITRLAEDKLREKYEIGIGKSLNANGFFFENDQFKLPENIFFNQNSIVLHYNQYEIAPYAFGPIDIEISNKQIEKYLITKKFEKEK
jgi:hypothetical protein